MSAEKIIKLKKSENTKKINSLRKAVELPPFLAGKLYL